MDGWMDGWFDGWSLIGSTVQSIDSSGLLLNVNLCQKTHNVFYDMSTIILPMYSDTTCYLCGREYCSVIK